MGVAKTWITGAVERMGWTPADTMLLVAPWQLEVRQKLQFIIDCVLPVFLSWYHPLRVPQLTLCSFAAKIGSGNTSNWGLDGSLVGEWLVFSAAATSSLKVFKEKDFLGAFWIALLASEQDLLRPSY